MKLKKAVLLGIVSIMTMSSLPAVSNASSYSDVPGHWAEPYITDMENAGVINQFSGGTLNPDKPMTREECAVLISDFSKKYYNYKPDYSGNYRVFRDLNDGENADKINALGRIYFISLMAGSIDDTSRTCYIVQGYPEPGASSTDKRFDPNAPVTRAEFSKMFYNAIDCFGYNSTGNYRRIPSDANLHWASMYISGLYEFGILNGYNTYQGDYYFQSWEYDYERNAFTGQIQTEGYSFGSFVEFKPDNYVTRAEAIKMVSEGRGRNYIGNNSDYGTRMNALGQRDSSLYHLHMSDGSVRNVN